MEAEHLNPSANLRAAIRSILARAESELDDLLTEARGAPVKKLVIGVLTEKGPFMAVSGCCCDGCTSVMRQHIDTALTLAQKADQGAAFAPDADGLVH